MLIRIVVKHTKNVAMIDMNLSKEIYSSYLESKKFLN
jgi:hypothetical protein